MTTSDTWGRPRPLAPTERRGTTVATAWVLVAVRGLVFLGGMFYALGITFVLAYGGLVGEFLLWAQVSLVPVAVAFWILASCTQAGDRWTVAYLSIWAAEGVVVWVGSTLFW